LSQIIAQLEKAARRVLPTVYNVAVATITLRFAQAVVPARDKEMLMLDRGFPWRLRQVAFLCVLAAAGMTVGVTAQSPPAGATAPVTPTFAKDVAPILYKNCVSCHKPGGVAPMSLLTYAQAKKYAPMIKHRTGLFPHAGTMPPYYLERNVGIQHYKDDIRLSPEQIATLASWADAGAPLGNPADVPPAPKLDDNKGWSIRPDIIVKSSDLFMQGGHPDWWGEITPIPIPLDEDRYVAAVQVREINDVPPQAANGTAVGGRFIVHHMIWSTVATDANGHRESTFWPVHELGRNADIFDPGAGQLLRAHSQIVSNSLHMHSNGRDTHAHLEIAFQLHKKGYKPTYPAFRLGQLGDGQNIDIEAEKDHQELHAYQVLTQNTKIISFEPHLHAPGERMCLEYIWGTHRETLTCVGYDHNWVKQYTYADGYQPLLPKGTILHVVGYMNNTDSNPEIPDPRNWQGSGNRSVQNMFIDLGRRVALTDEQFVDEMAQRRERFHWTKNDQVIGCPLCLAAVPTPGAKPADMMKAASKTTQPAEGDR
jgi:hypothetical protein